MQFERTIKFNVPEADTLKQHYKSVASVSEDGEVVYLGDYRAEKVGFLSALIWGKRWDVISTDPGVSITLSGAEALDARAVVNALAEMSTKNSIDEAIVNPHLATALQAKISELKPT